MYQITVLIALGVMLVAGLIIIPVIENTQAHSGIKNKVKEIIGHTHGRSGTGLGSGGPISPIDMFGAITFELP